MNFSYSKLSSWRRCKYRFHLQYGEGYRSRKSLGQIRGTAGHAALDKYYSTDRNIMTAIDHAWEVYRKEAENEINQEDWELLERVLIRYDTWAKAHDKFEVINTEQHFEIPFEDDLVFEGIIDGVVKVGNDHWLLEHKFNKKVQVAGLDVDQQVTSYMLAAHLLGFEPIGVFYNIVRVDDGPTAVREPVVRKMIFRNVEGLAYYAEELRLQMNEARKFLETPGPTYRNMTHDCSWDCSFLDVCLSLNEQGSADKILERYEKDFHRE